MKATLKIMAATALFAAVHSALASRPAKRLAAKTIGQRNRNGLYRLFYIGQSVVTFGALALYIKRQPGVVLYEVQRPLGLPLRAAQLGCLAVAANAAHQVDLRRITGLASFQQWWGPGEVEPEPEAQGPALNDDGLLVAGPFRWSRHPLNFWPMPVLWLNPRMTTNLLAFNTAATIYLVIGSAHEEARLSHAYGAEYDAYRTSYVPFYLPQ